MRPAIDASRALTVALTAAQGDALKALDALATRCSRQMSRLAEQYEETARVLKQHHDEGVEELRQIREGVLSLAAEIRDGSDDMAQAMAKLLGPKVIMAPADPETTALAQKLAPRPVVAEAAE